MRSAALVQLGLEALSCSQKELALRLGVSPSQITKWKNGEYMSPDMEQKFGPLINIGNADPQVVVWTGSAENANKWDRLIHFLADQAIEDAETGYDTYPLEDESETLCWSTFHTLEQMGVHIPKPFPEELDIDYDRALEDGSDNEPWDVLHTNPYSALIHNIYKSLNDVYGFYAAYVNEIVNDDELEMHDTAAEIESCLIELAASKIDLDERFAPRMKNFKYKVRKQFEEWLTAAKDKAFRAGIPLRAELLDMIYDSHDQLGHEAEAESLGFNASRVHPDIYMNELLCGMRIIHQVLPAILKKLGIDEEFKLDESKLRLG